MRLNERQTVYIDHVDSGLIVELRMESQELATGWVALWSKVPGQGGAPKERC